MKVKIFIGLVFFSMLVAATVYFVLDPYAFLITVEFEDLQKVQNGDKVYMKGLEIGHIIQTSFDKKGIPFVKIKINQDYLTGLSSKMALIIKDDSWLTGRKCLECIDMKGKRPLKNGHVFKGYDSWMKWKATILKKDSKDKLKDAWNYLRGK